MKRTNWEKHDNINYVKGSYYETKDHSISIGIRPIFMTSNHKVKLLIVKYNKDGLGVWEKVVAEGETFDIPEISKKSTQIRTTYNKFMEQFGGC